MNRDPFDELGLDHGAGADAVRAARRRLAKRHHPDTGGDAAHMRRVNAAAAAALRTIADRTANRTADRTADRAPTGTTHDASESGDVDAMASDVPSFTVEALPAETFEALLVVVTWIGEALDDDPPYRLDTHLHAPIECWCRLDLVPDAGASTVSITVASVGGRPLPPVEAVRDVWVDQLNRYDW